MTDTATIIVPLLKQKPEYLAQCLLSAVEQTVPCRVLIVVSPRTPPDNLEIVDRIPGIERLMRRRQPFAAAINTGIDAATTERVAILLSDDWLEPHAVETCLRHDADIVSASSGIYCADGATRMPFSRPRSRERYLALQTLHDQANYLGHFFLFRRDALLAVGGVDQEIGNVGPDDFDLIWSLLENGASVAIVEEELYGYRDHDGPRLTLRDRDAQIADLKKIFDKHGIVGEERERLIAHHARWFGKTLRAVMEE
jgi:glycosyltransferase involved in cell wall biosynthesis